MNVLKQPTKKTYERDAQLTQTVMDIIDHVRKDGDQALLDYAAKFDHVELDSVRVSPETVKAAYEQVDPDTLEAIRFSTNPYNVNRLTLRAGAAALAEQDYYDANCAAIVDTRADTKRRLEALGFTCTDSRANFLFARHPAADGGDLYRRLKERGVLVRRFDAPRIGDYIRITIGTRAQMDALLERLEGLL